MYFSIISSLSLCLVIYSFTLSNEFLLVSASHGGIRYSRSIKREAIESNLVEGAGQIVDTNEEGSYNGGFNPDCYESAFVTPLRKTFKIELSSDVLAAHKVKCHWDIIGTDYCIPVLSCKKFKLLPTDPKSEEPCPVEHLEVTDGLGGYQRFCGGDGPQNITTANGLRDLYITFQGKSPSDPMPGRGLKCAVTCSEKNAPATKVLEENFEPTKNEFCNCGRKPNGNRIVGGEDALKGEFPWMVALVAAYTRKPYCGGTVINDRFILTAAHCFKGPYLKIKNFQVLAHGYTLDLTTTEGTAGEGNEVSAPSEDVLNALNERDVEDESVRFNVEKYYMHPLYVRQTNDYDIALIQLKEKIDFNKYKFIMPACMPNIYDYNVTYEGVDATVAGWGLGGQDATSTMGTLQKLNVTIFNSQDCKGFYAERVTRRMMCAGYKEAGKDSCKGDSGGPLVALKAPQIWSIIGTVSFGSGCAQANAPGVYQRVSELNQWIRYISNLGGATWCRDKD